MHVFFLMMVAVCIGLFGSAGYYVFVDYNLHFHAFFGLITTVAILITHCWVFFYFIGTGEGIREGVLEHRLNPDSIKKTKKFKGKTFPFALFSMIFAIVATIVGAGIQTGDTKLLTHRIFVYVMLAFNLFTFYQESRIIRINENLMKDLNRQIEV